jgi:hypothetical protein
MLETTDQVKVKSYIETLSPKDRLIFEAQFLLELVSSPLSHLRPEVRYALTITIFIFLCSLMSLSCAAVSGVQRNVNLAPPTGTTVPTLGSGEVQPTVQGATAQPGRYVQAGISTDIVISKDSWLWQDCRAFLSSRSEFLGQSGLPVYMLDSVIYKGCVQPIVDQNHLRNPNLVHAGDKFKLNMSPELVAQLQQALAGKLR